MGILTQKSNGKGVLPKGLFSEKLELSNKTAKKSRVSELLNQKKRVYVDVYHRPTFNRILTDSPSDGHDFTSEFKFENVVKITGRKREFEISNYDFDDWSEEEKKEYDAKFAFTPINDEVADILFMEVPGIEKDAFELEDFKNEAEFDISYGSLPEFLPDVIKEQPVIEETVEETVEIPVEETVEIPIENIAEETEISENILVLEEPKVAGLLEEAEAVPAVEETIETVIELAAPAAVEETVEETYVAPIAEKTTFSIGFGTASAANVGETVFSFGFGYEEAEEETVEITAVSANVDSGVFASSNADGHTVTL